MSSGGPKKIALIIGSVRPVRVGPQVVEIVHNAFKRSELYSSAEVTVLDIASFNLPVFNEKVMPAMVSAQAVFESEHSKKWSAAIEPYDGYAFVTAEYNAGVPGGAKNAIDYLYNEWVGKPMLIISYGTFGGANASFNLKRTFEGMKLRVLPIRPRFSWVGGPYGTDAQGAMLTGNLGESSTKAWGESADLVKGFEELIEFVNDPTKKGTEATFDGAEYNN
ncbi:hypothetical protein DL98DRAFT_438479 [Cadophora sp. DSE1049]|nr:hypothetical protein DL98DRAFT_438479 [Cadophora sp. DSE1049]